MNIIAMCIMGATLLFMLVSTLYAIAVDQTFAQSPSHLHWAHNTQLDNYTTRSIVPQNSSCFDAFDYNVSPQIISRKLNARRERDGFYKVIQASNLDRVRRLKGVNFGHGTTGTRYLSCYFRAAFGMHVEHYRGFGGWMSRFRETCLRGMRGPRAMNAYYDEKRCRNSALLSDLARQVASVIVSYDFMMDTPAANIMIDLALAMPDLYTMVSLRKVSDMYASRVKHHSPTVFILCHPMLWDHPYVLSPLDWVGCMEARPDSHVNETFIFAKDFIEMHPDGLEVIFEAYRQMISVNYIVVSLTSKFPILSICLFDESKIQSADAVAKYIGERMKRNEWLPTYNHALNGTAGATHRECLST